MKNTNSSRGSIGAGLIAALAASSCCIPPLIAAVAGIGGLGASLAWIAPFRPYLIGFAVLAIGYAWFVYFKSKKLDDCGCDVAKPKFYQTWGFLIAITVFARCQSASPTFLASLFPKERQPQHLYRRRVMLWRPFLSLTA